MEQVIKIHELLKGRKSYISFLLHDNIVIDFNKEDKDLVKVIYDVFRKTRLGDFVVSIKMGKNYKDMKKIQLNS